VEAGGSKVPGGWKQYISTSILHSINRLEVVKYTWKVGNELDWILGVNGGRRDGWSGRKWKEAAERGGFLHLFRWVDSGCLLIKLATLFSESPSFYRKDFDNSWGKFEKKEGKEAGGTTQRLIFRLPGSVLKALGKYLKSSLCLETFIQ
jgi:hypothetical protein